MGVMAIKEPLSEDWWTRELIVLSLYHPVYLDPCIEEMLVGGAITDHMVVDNGNGRVVGCGRFGKEEASLDVVCGFRDSSCQSSTSKATSSKVVRRKKKTSRAAFSSSLSSLPSQQKGLRLIAKRRVLRVSNCCNRRGESDFDALAFTIGMSIAAVVAQVLDREHVAKEKIPLDHLSTICASAVRESLAHAFGDRFDCFVRNFEKYFGSTLGVLRIVNEAFVYRGRGPFGESSTESCGSEVVQPKSLYKQGHGSHSEPVASASEGWRPSNAVEEIQENLALDPINQELGLHGQMHQLVGTLGIVNEASLYKGRGPFAESSTESCSSEVFPPKSLYNQGHGSHSEPVASAIEACRQSNAVEEIQENLALESTNRELALHGQMLQLAASSSSILKSGYDNSMLSTFERSVKEQARSNDLKTFEVGLIMKRLQLKESQLALHSNSNRLEKFKLALGISKAEFRAEKFKNQLEDARHIELLKKCIDSLVAGLLIMSAALLYGAYFYSYERIIDATGSCSFSTKEATSWWIPKQVASFNSWLVMLKTLRCQVEVFSRMLFGVLMIVAIAYLLFQRSASSNQIMPVTFILLLLGVGCGIVGKLCIDTLGGNGYHWFLYWEALCLLHFFANMFTSALFSILYGPVSVAQGTEARTLLPYWLRRLVFFVLTLLFLPLFGGLMPFASLTDWKDHFLTYHW
ncbi:hypothetical protein NE237_029859 [Protea cynaroides]|uniref:Protein CPR-5 n=1 Tax=Protea cynaroides TaxID=273540 RepID=A0A9Q0JVI0_9MAGN|nr:hypothetical protein NE237_029859 [Protea cynaroides]